MISNPHPAQAADLATRLVAAAGDAIVIANRDGRILTWNKGAEAIFGYPVAEAMDASLDLIIPERLRGRHWDGFHQALRTGETRYADDLLAVPAQRRDGTRISIEFRVTLLLGPDGAPEAIAAVIRDVTSRWEADRALRQELERLRTLTASASSPGDETTTT
jgi:PAS domain S-box-containing protein